MKKWLFLLIIPVLAALIFISSCNDDNDFGEDDTFNLDTLAVLPPTINEKFTIAWGVTTTGYPLFFIDIYLSEDDILSEDDLMIGTTSSADLSEEVDFDEQQYFMIEDLEGSDNVVILHNEKTPDVEDTGWTESEETTNPSGTSQYIIGNCYHTTGLVIKYGPTTRLAVPVTFQ